MMRVPQTISTSPSSIFRLSLSWSIMREIITVTTMLSLSTGTTTLTIPFWIALIVTQPRSAGRQPGQRDET